MRKYGNLVATLGEYTGDDGKPQKRRRIVGVVMRDDVSGKLSIRLDALPVWPGWSGWFRCEPDTVDGAPRDGAG